MEANGDSDGTTVLLSPETSPKVVTTGISSEGKNLDSARNKGKGEGEGEEEIVDVSREEKEEELERGRVEEEGEEEISREEKGGKEEEEMERGEGEEEEVVKVEGDEKRLVSTNGRPVEIIGPGAGSGLFGKDDATPTSTNSKTNPSNGVTSDGEGVAGPAHIDVDVVFEGEEGEEGEGDGALMSPTPAEKITIQTVQKYRPGQSVNVYLPGVPVIAVIMSNLTSSRSRGAQFVISLEHGPFEWKVYKYYTDFLSLRRVLAPLRLRIRIGRIGRGRKRGYLPHLLTVNDINPLQINRTQNQLPKCRKFLNAVLNDREFRSHRSTLKFLEISRLSFVEDLGPKRKEGVITKRSGGHRRVTNCLGCASCCICRCSVWRPRWLVLKDSFLAYIRSDRRTIAGVLLFDEGMAVRFGSIQTGLVFGVEIRTHARTLLVKCPSRKAMKEWREELSRVMASTGKMWVTEKRFLSFAPSRERSVVQWFVDGEEFMSQVADALLAAKEEIFITDWMISPQIYLKRSRNKSSVHNLNFRLDKILLRKAIEGVKVYIQIYKEVTVAISLGSEYARDEFKHPNIVVFRHPEHIHTGVYLWAHHEKIVAIDQTLAFVGGIDLAFGRYDNHCHELCDKPYNVDIQSEEVATSYKWHGKDYHNPFYRDITRHHLPFEDDLDRDIEPRMPWHDVASCVFGAPARDVARHFIQRHNFTRHEQSLLDDFLLPRGEFCGTSQELAELKYLKDIIDHHHTTTADVQVLRSADQWSVGIVNEHSILNAYIETIKKAEHFIYIENQFFISSLKEVRNTIADALRARIVKAHRNREKFRVIVVMPLLPSFNGDLADSKGNVPKAIIHWNYKTLDRGEESLCSKLEHTDGVPSDEISDYLSVYGLRTYGQIEDKLVTEIVYVHSKCMIVDDRYTIIGSANINDRSMLGERDSEMAVYVEDREMIEGVMDGQAYSVGKFAHSLRCQLFREHLGLLQEQHLHAQSMGLTTESRQDVSVQDPLCDEFFKSWSSIAASNMEIYEEVFGGRNIPSNSAKTYSQFRTFKETTGLADTSPSDAKKKLSHVQGYLVPMPSEFLSGEDLLPPFGAKESFAPEIFT